MQVPCHVKTCVEVHRFSARKERVRPYYLGLQGSFIFMSPCTSKHLIRTQIHSRSTVDLYEHVICAKEITFRMNQTKIRGAEAALDYNFHDLHILWEALQAAGSGVMRSGPRLFDNGNSKLAVLGDTVADMVLCQVWYEQGNSKGNSADPVHFSTQFTERSVQMLGIETVPLSSEISILPPSAAVIILERA